MRGLKALSKKILIQMMRKVRTADCGLRTANKTRTQDGIKRGLSVTDWVENTDLGIKRDSVTLKFTRR